MVIRGRTRGGGAQLAKYLLTQGENERIQILDVDGRENANDNHLRNALLSMSLTSELTKSDKGLYHAQINPAYGEDRQMSDEDWLKAADMLGKDLELEEQRRVIVLHTKKGRTHGHVVWERYDHEKKKMISDSFSRLAQDRARLAMEQVFEQQPTAHRNQKRPEMKERLSDLWQKLKSGADFVKAAKQFGYVVAAGVQRRPFMVVDDTGRSFDLVRQLAGVKTKEVREKLKGEKLVAEKDAIALVRQKQKLQGKLTKEAGNDNKQKRLQGKEKTTSEFAPTPEDVSRQERVDFAERKRNLAEGFAQNRQGATNKENTADEKKKERLAGEFAASRDEQTKVVERDSQDRKNKVVAEGFAHSRNDMTAKPEVEIKTAQDKKNEGAAQDFAINREDATQEKESTKETAKREFLKTLKDMEQGWQSKKDKGRSPG